MKIKILICLLLISLIINLASVYADENSTIKSNAKDIDYAKNYKYNPTEDDYCQNIVYLTDIIKETGFILGDFITDVTAISEEEEMEASVEVFEYLINEEFAGLVDTDPLLVNYINDIAEPLVAQVERPIEYDFHIIDDDETINAFAILGGHIFIYTGMIKFCDNEAQLAGIIAHEISHVEARHCVAYYQYLQQLPELAQDIGALVIQLIQEPFNAGCEREADALGTTFCYNADYSVYQIVELWKKMDKEFFQIEQEDIGEKIDIGEEIDVGEEIGVFADMFNMMLSELDNMFSTHPYPRVRACYLMELTIKLQEENPKEKLYVGDRNYWNHKAKSKKQW